MHRLKVYFTSKNKEHFCALVIAPHCEKVLMQTGAFRSDGLHEQQPFIGSSTRNLRCSRYCFLPRSSAPTGFAKPLMGKNGPSCGKHCISLWMFKDTFLFYVAIRVKWWRREKVSQISSRGKRDGCSVSALLCCKNSARTGRFLTLPTTCCDVYRRSRVSLHCFRRLKQMLCCFRKSSLSPLNRATNSVVWYSTLTDCLLSIRYIESLIIYKTKTF